MTGEYGRILRALEKGVQFMDSSLNFVLKDQCNPLTPPPPVLSFFSKKQL